MTELSSPSLRPRFVTRIACALGLVAVGAWLVGLAIVVASASREGLLAFLISLPFVAWLAHFSAWAVFRGQLPASPCWPFASHRVLLVYLAMVPVMLRAAFA